MQIFKKFVQFIRLFEREAAAARPAQGGKMCAAVERLSDFMGQRADVSPFTATDADAHAGQGILQYFHFVDGDHRLADGDLFPGAGQLVGACAVDLLGGVDGWGLQPLPGERLKGLGEGFPRDVLCWLM